MSPKGLSWCPMAGCPWGVHVWIPVMVAEWMIGVDDLPVDEVLLVIVPMSEHEGCDGWGEQM